MKAVGWILIIVLLWCGTVFADTMEGQGTAVGNAVLWFSGTSVKATFEGTFTLTGQLVLADTVIPFSATGWARGAGSGDTATLDIEAWATFAVSGSTEAGEEIVVQGGLTLSGLSADTAGASGSGSGDFFATIFIGGQQHYAHGSADGSVTGMFVVPEDPLSMELAGDGFFNLSGEMTLVSPVGQGNDSSNPDGSDPESHDNSSMVELLPWDPETWPEELLAQLLDILTSIVETPAATEEGSQTE